jgi:hypothetical protein
VVDIEQRQFRQLYSPDVGVSFHSQRGRQMVKAMLGTGWRAFTPRHISKKRAKQVV